MNTSDTHKVKALTYQVPLRSVIILYVINASTSNEKRSSSFLCNLQMIQRSIHVIQQIEYGLYIHFIYFEDSRTQYPDLLRVVT